MKFLDYELKPGQKLKGQMAVNDTATIPVWMICGAKPGKTLVITTGVHGCEYVGIQTVRKMYDSFDTSDLQGNVIILPFINASGFYQGLKQLMAEDGRNLNRMFPGDKEGTFSQQVAYSIEKNIYPMADFLIDLHGGDINESLTDLVFFPVANDVDLDIRRISMEAAQHMKVPYRVRSTASNGLYSWATRCGVPALLLEIGCLAKWTDQQTEICQSSLYNLMGYLGMGYPARINSTQKESNSAWYFSSQHNGFWYPEVYADETVKSGDLLGTVYDLDGEVLQKIYAPDDVTIWYYTTTLGVAEGDPLIACGTLK